jgi:hypothetical protein
VNGPQHAPFGIIEWEDAGAYQRHGKLALGPVTEGHAATAIGKLILKIPQSASDGPRIVSKVEVLHRHPKRKWTAPNDQPSKREMTNEAF